MSVSSYSVAHKNGLFFLFFFLAEQQSPYCGSIKPVLSPAPAVGFSMITGSSKISGLSPFEYRLAHRIKVETMKWV